VQLDLSAAPHLEVEIEGILNLQSQQKIQPAEVKNQSKFQHQKKHLPAAYQYSRRQLTYSDSTSLVIPEDRYPWEEAFITREKFMIINP
jgi:hypothetical protein